MTDHVAALVIGVLVGATFAHLRTRTWVLRGVGVPLIAFLVLSALDKVDPLPVWAALTRTTAKLIAQTFWMSGLVGMGIGLAFWERTPFDDTRTVPLFTTRGNPPCE